MTKSEDGGAASLAVADVIAERCRQIEAEGWSPEHDDQHSDSSLAQAAACYAHPQPRLTTPGWPYQKPYPIEWPSSWTPHWWKPKDRRRDLVRAAALIIAEIERLDRLAARTGAAP